MFSGQDNAYPNTRLGIKTRGAMLPWMVVFCGLLFGVSAQATSIRQLSFDQVAKQAELVFEGEVVAVEARWNADRSHIQTFVTFRITEVLKGSHAPTSLTLSFVGGTVANTTEKFDGLIYPKFGENGIYFVENVSRPQLNPLVGWSQGHYKIVRHQGVDRMLTASRQPVVEIQKQISADSLTGRTGKQTGDRSVGHVTGLDVGNEVKMAVSKDDFKREIIKRLNQR